MGFVVPGGARAHSYRSVMTDHSNLDVEVSMQPLRRDKSSAVLSCLVRAQAIAPTLQEL
jgi:hypothetical protein